MPIPERHKGESRDSFMGRCMADATMNKEYPDQKQRAAICYRQSGEPKPKKAETALDIPQPAGDEGKTDKLVIPPTGGNPIKVNEAGKRKALELIRAGKIDDKTNWSWDQAEGASLLGPNGNDWGSFQSAHLGEDTTAQEETQERYAHPFAKDHGEGLTLYRSALASIRLAARKASADDMVKALDEIDDALTSHDRDKARGKTTEAQDDHAADDGTSNPAERTLRKAREGRDAADSQQHPMNIRAALSITAQDEPSANAGASKGPPRFEMVANTGKVPMRLDGWKYPVVMDLSGMQIPSQSRPIRLQHDSGQGVGHTDYIGFNDQGELVARGIISRHTGAAQDVVESARKGFPWQASVGASADEVEFVKSGDESPVNGYLLKGPANIVRRSTLGEISFVDIGGDDSTSAKVAAMAKDGIEGDGATQDRVEWGVAVARAEAETNRQKGIEQLVAQYVARPGADLVTIKKIQVQAMTDGWNLTQTELELLRRTRPAAPGPRWAKDEPSQPKVIEAALLLYMGSDDRFNVDGTPGGERKKVDEILAADREYGPDVVQEAWRFRNRGLQGTIAAALAQSGIPVPYGKRELFDSILEARHVRAEGFSTINLPGILGNVANKVLLLAFLNVESTYNIIAEQADFANFQTHTMYRLEYMGDFQIVGNDGELKSSNLGQDSFTNKLDTRGALLTLTRQNIINDDLNAFRTLIAQLARKARIAAEKALYGVVMESADVFYTSAKGNRLTSMGISITGYADAEAALQMMTDAGGDPIYATPRFVLVPPALRYFADQMYVSATMAGITTTQLPTDNPFKGRFVTVSSPYLQNSNMPGYSATTWYLLADPLMLAAYQMAYLDGRRAPTIETADAEFNVLGLHMRAYWDFGVAQLDGRGAVKCTA